MTDQPNTVVGISPDSPDRYDRILHTLGSTFDSLGTWPDHPRALEALADAVEQLIDTELEASQRRAIRIQTLLDDTRDRVRKLHQRYADGTCWADGEPYPCPTIAALEPPKEQPQ